MKILGKVLLGIALAAAPLSAAEPGRRTENVVVIVTDGLRWQEVFTGAEAALVSEKPGGVEDVPATSPPEGAGVREGSPLAPAGQGEGDLPTAARPRVPDA